MFEPVAPDRARSRRRASIQAVVVTGAGTPHVVAVVVSSFFFDWANSGLAANRQFVHRGDAGGVHRNRLRLLLRALPVDYGIRWRRPRQRHWPPAGGASVLLPQASRRRYPARKRFIVVILLCELSPVRTAAG